MSPVPPDMPASPSIPVQHLIEAALQRYEKEGRWDCAYLFSSEGLLLAKCGASDYYGEDRLLEFAFSLIQTVRLLGDEPLSREVQIRGGEPKAMVFRYFEAWNEFMILAVVVSDKKGYKRALSDVIRQIQAAPVMDQENPRQQVN
jgi:hypothetical protein